jgi:16S rRNA (uracil1498-N3)-methyltransferase
MSRFFSERPITGGEVTLSGPEAHHLLHVLRAAEGQIVTLFDGTGQEFQARIVDRGRTDVRLWVESSQLVSREPSAEITLGVALPKGERQRWLVEKAVELGISSLVPLVAEHGVAQPTKSALDRLRRTVIEATKQCGRTRLMQIAEPMAAQVYLAEHRPRGGEEALAVCAHPSGVQHVPCSLRAARRVALAVGPEGGFTPAEVMAAKENGWIVAQLGPRILRVETAAIALAALVSLGPVKGTGTICSEDSAN